MFFFLIHFYFQVNLFSLISFSVNIERKLPKYLFLHLFINIEISKMLKNFVILQNFYKPKNQSLQKLQIKSFLINNTSKSINDKNNLILNKISKKPFNSLANTENSVKPEIIEITKPTVYTAKSNNIIFNLSTEELFYEFQNIKKPILFLWQNDTNVVIGKHQNPWKECKITNMHQNKVQLASKF